MKQLSRAVQTVGFFSMWSSKALAGDAITLIELADLAEGLGRVFGLGLRVELPVDIVLTEAAVTGVRDPRIFVD